MIEFGDLSTDPDVVLVKEIIELAALVAEFVVDIHADLVIYPEVVEHKPLNIEGQLAHRPLYHIQVV